MLTSFQGGSRCPSLPLGEQGGSDTSCRSLPILQILQIHPADPSASSHPPGRPDTDGYPHPKGDHRPFPYHQAFPVSSHVPQPCWVSGRQVAGTVPVPWLLVPPCPCTCSEAYPSCTVTNVQFCFDVRKLMKLDAER